MISRQPVIFLITFLLPVSAFALHTLSMRLLPWHGSTARRCISVKTRASLFKLNFNILSFFIFVRCLGSWTTTWVLADCPYVFNMDKLFIIRKIEVGLRDTNYFGRRLEVVSWRMSVLNRIEPDLVLFYVKFLSELKDGHANVY